MDVQIFLLLDIMDISINIIVKLKLYDTTIYNTFNMLSFSSGDFGLYKFKIYNNDFN